VRRPAGARRRAGVAAALAAVVLAGSLPAAAHAQSRPDLRLQWEDGRTERLTLSTDRGYAALPADALGRLGWSVTVSGDAVRADGPSGSRLELRAGSPFFRWNDEVLQLTDPVYRSDGRMRVPAQLLTDFLPRRLGQLYDFEGPALTLRSATGGESGVRQGGGTSPAGRGVARSDRAGSEESADGGAAPAEGPPVRRGEPALRATPYDGPRVVVIDAGHGGRDPGSMSDSGIREKEVALGVARALAEELRGRDGLEVHLLREDDTFVPIWQRGIRATEIKGDRPGLFVSIHANAFTNMARGFETYFLSEARTEHERRVAAMENAPLQLEEEALASGDDLGFILRELRNFDHAHWSAFMAEMVQEELDRIHPGPNRGVKQAPLAVLTNSLMPSVLVEVGYLSHPDEARLLARPDFQRDAGAALAQAVTRFFERYPPGSTDRTGAGG